MEAAHHNMDKHSTPPITTTDFSILNPNLAPAPLRLPRKNRSSASGRGNNGLAISIGRVSSVSPALAALVSKFESLDAVASTEGRGLRAEATLNVAARSLLRSSLDGHRSSSDEGHSAGVKDGTSTLLDSGRDSPGLETHRSDKFGDDTSQFKQCRWDDTQG
jgi:hypothetical protein